MSENPIKEGKTHRKVILWIAWILSGFAALMLLMACSIYFLVPYTISTPWFRSYIEASASRELHRSVSIQAMEFGWAKGLRMESVRLADAPPIAEKPMGSIDLLQVTLNFGDLIRERRLNCDISLDAVTLRIVRETDGNTNLKRFLSALSSRQEGSPSTGDNKTSFALPLSDLTARCRVRGMTLHYDDRKEKQTGRLHGASFDIHVPSLLHEPLSFKASAEVYHNGKSLSPLNAYLKIDGLLDGSGAFQFDRASIDMEVTAPGLQVDLKVKMLQKRVQAVCRADLGKILPAILSVFPKSSFIPVKSGIFLLNANATQIEGDRSAFELHIQIKTLEVQGVSGEPRPFGPTNIDFRQKGILSFPQGNLEIETGTLSFNSSRITWQGNLQGFKGDNPRIRITAGPSVLNLRELTAAAKHFLSTPLPLKMDDSPSPASLKINQMEISGNPSQGRLHLDIRGLSADATALRIFYPKDSVFAVLDSLTVSFSRIQGRLQDFYPAEGFAEGSASLVGLKVSGGTDLHLDALRLSDVHLNTQALRIDKSAPFGITLPFSLSASIAASGIRAFDFGPARLALSALKIDGDLGSTHLADVSIKGIRVEMPSIERAHRTLGKLRGDLRVDADAPEIRIKGIHPLRADARRFQSRILLGKGVELLLTGDALGSGKEKISADAALTADLGKLKEMLPDLLGPSRQLHGKVQMKCRLSGRTPTLETLQGDAAEAIFDSKASPLESVFFSLELSRVGGTWPLDGKDALNVESITTRTPLTYAFDGKTALGKFDGDIRIEQLRLPALQVQSSLLSDSPVSLQVSISGEHQRNRALSLSTSLKVRPLDFTSTLSLSLDGIDALFKPSVLENTREWPKFMTGSAKVAVSLPEMNALSLNREARIHGGFDAGAEIEMHPENGLRFKAWSKTRDLDIEKGETIRLENLMADLSFERRYHTFSDAGQENPMPDPLSETLIREKSWRGVSPPDSGTLGSVNTKVQALLNRKPSLSFGPAHFYLPAHGVPVRHFVADLRFVEGLPRIRRLEAHLLGGAIVGSAGISRNDGGFGFEAQLAFSGIDFKQLMGGTENQQGDEDSAVTGQLEVAFPLTSSLRHLIENLQVGLQFNHIGSRAFGRLLYLIDPYESNETIVSQRRLLRNGTPRWIDIHIQSGILSLDGELEIRGFPVKIPHLERLNMAAVSGLETYEQYLALMDPFIAVLKIASDPEPPLDLIQPLKRKM